MSGKATETVLFRLVLASSPCCGNGRTLARLYHALHWRLESRQSLIHPVKNADNSNTQPGDTVVDQWTTVGNVAWDTGYLGPYSSTLGTKCFFGLRVEVKTSGAYSYTTRSVGIRAAPRCDIPFPWTTCGLDASGNPLISPGGIVTGAVPGY